MFALTVFEILLFESKSVLSPAQRETGSEGVKASVKNEKNIWNFLEMLEKWLTYKLRKFWMVFKFFWFCLTLSVPEKLKKSIFEMPIITQTLNIKNLRTTSVKSVILNTNRNLVKYSLKNFLEKAIFILIFLETLLSEVRSVLRPSQRDTGSKRVKVSVRNLKNIGNLLKLLEKWLTYKLRRFWMTFNFFSICLTVSVRENLKNSIFERSIITQTLNITNLRTTSAKSINLHAIRKLVEYSLKNLG